MYDLGYFLNVYVGHQVCNSNLGHINVKEEEFSASIKV